MAGCARMSVGLSSFMSGFGRTHTGCWREAPCWRRGGRDVRRSSSRPTRHTSWCGGTAWSPRSPPFSLLVSPVGIVTAWIVLCEQPRTLAPVEAVLVLAGLSVMDLLVA